ncbi:MAG: hypothetical protein OXK76_16090 [Gammaproteobacteria bacterium]|nr:hypothetical protein [Gammaproteobacteria bacterium]
MDELSVEERVRRVIGAADRKRKRSLPSGSRGDLIQRVCLSACQILQARPDGRNLRLRQEPPASDYPDIWARLNRQWREQQTS